MKVVFLELDQEIEWAMASIGPAFIAAYLRQYGYEVILLRIPLQMPVEQCVDRIRALSPDIIGVSLTSRQWLRAREVIPRIKQTLDIPIIAGGLHATFASDLILESPGFDYVCLGEGEQAMLDFVRAIERNEMPPNGIKNIRAKGDSLPTLRPPFAPIDELPFMARDMLDEKYGVVNMVTQRGCPYPCTYCAARQFSDLYDGSYASYGRRRSHENVLHELQNIKDSGQLNYVIFLDDTFTINHAWVKEFCHLYGQQFRIPFSIHARAETVNQEMLRQLAAAGCMHITYGVESGSERVRREVMDRRISNDRLRAVFNWARETGILVTANYMLGIPGETKDDIEQTLALHEDLMPDDFGYFVFYPYPGTPLFKLCQNYGYLPENFYDLPANHHQSILSLPDLTKNEIAEYYEKFTEIRKRDYAKKYSGATFNNEDIASRIDRHAIIG